MSTRGQFKTTTGGLSLMKYLFVLWHEYKVNLGRERTAALESGNAWHVRHVNHTQEFYLYSIPPLMEWYKGISTSISWFKICFTNSKVQHLLKLQVQQSREKILSTLDEIGSVNLAAMSQFTSKLHLYSRYALTICI